MITDEYDYKGFGGVLNRAGTTQNLYLFVGEQFDEVLDQYYLRARYYNQSIGRFTQMDIWRGDDDSPVTLNKYLYANVDPVGNIDPSGYMSMVSLSAGINGFSTLSTIALPSFSRAMLSATVVVGASLLYQDINFVLNVESAPESSAAEEAQNQAEYEAAKRFCDDQKPDPGRNDCATLSKLIDHAEQCIAMYDAWDDKWLKGRHDEKIQSWKNRAEKLNKEHKRRCTNK